MAVTGVIGFGFVIAHLLGNLQFYMGPEALNDYAAALRANPGVLMVARLVLLTAVVLHIYAALQLTSRNSSARPEGYRVWTARKSSYASRTMKFSGPLLGLFIVYHLLHLTLGSAHPHFRHGPNGLPDVYHNVVTGFSQVPVALAYIAAMAMLGLHLSHGVWSMFQSLGWNHPRYSPLVRRFAVLITVLIVLGNISIPLSVLLGFHEQL
ncbi:MAG: succinate dehydrogenase cytochrome b subunit [Bryobacterales bacterium]|nr:succinate dehydrogenase cytochrome b subunit [Bryobacterales bacterium]